MLCVGKDHQYGALKEKAMRWQGNSADVNFWLAILFFRIARGGWQAAGVMKP